MNFHDEDLRILTTLIQAVHKFSDLEEIYRVALDSVMQLENVDMATVYLVDEERREAILQAHRNLPEDYIRRASRISYPIGVTWKVINTGKILNIEDAQKDPDIGPAGKDVKPHGCLGIPIFLEEKAIGVIWFASYKEHEFNEREVNLLSTFGTQIGIAIAKVKKEETLRNSVAQLSKKSKYESIISTVTRSVHQSINLQEVLESAIESMSKNMDKVEHVSIYLVEGDEVVIKAHRGYPDWFIERVRRIPYPKGAIWKTVIEGKIRYVADIDKDTAIEPAGREIGTKSYLCMPIHFEGEAIGALIINSLKKDDFDEEELKLLEIVVQQIEIAINNAKQAEALLESRNFYLKLFDQFPALIWRSGIDAKYDYFNKSWLEFTGKTIEQEMNDGWIQGVHPEDLDQCMKTQLDAFIARQPFKMEYRLRRYDGEYRWIICAGRPFYDLRGNFGGYIGLCYDITDRRRMEEERLKFDKLESLGVLAGGIAHDFNNMLSAILTTISVTKMDIYLRADSYNNLTEMERVCIQAKGLTQQLLTFSKGGAPIKKLYSIGEIISDSSSFALRGSNTRCEFSIDDDLWDAEVDQSQIAQVISNLVINAQQAMAQGGVIKISAKNTELGGGFAPVHIKEGKYVKITVEDQGVGIPKEHLSKIFDLYFTTKQRGSGLGLAAAYWIIKNHDGFIDVESEVGKGSKFYVYIPAPEKKVERERKTGIDTRLEKVSRGRVLIMDDEAIIRKSAGKGLTQIGYEVEYAKDGQEAIEIYKRAKEENKPFDVVIIDLTVPGGMGGEEAIKKLIDIDPEIKAIVSSGYSNDAVMSEYKGYGFRGVISKPYNIEELAEMIRKVINEE